MSKLAKALTAAAGNAGGDNLYVEDVFSTYLYTGDGDASPITINNGIDLENEGGLIWVKKRNQSGNHYIHDTDMVSDRYLSSNNNFDLQGGVHIYPTSTGFTSENKIQDNFNYSGDKYTSWTFRKAEKFFDVVTYTGDGNATKAISHNLGSTPGFIVVKRTNGTGYWIAGHNSDYTKYLMLNETNGFQTWTGNWNATDSAFTAYSSANASFSLNNSGDTYVAYLFASDAGGFGDDGSENIIKCGSFTNNSASVGVEVNCGFEPQWLLIKGASSGSGLGNWVLIDSMRGASVDSQQRLYANASTAEGSSNWFKFTSQGFTPNTYFDGDLIYIAIRRPMKTPESGTEVFAIDTAGGTSPTPPTYNSGFPVDFFFNKGTGGVDGYAGSRLQGAEYLTLNSTAAATSSSTYEYDFMDGARSYNWTNSSWYAWMFKRATGFFDVVAYTGNGTAGATQAHNLGVAPECMIVKRRDGASSWITYWESLGATKGQFLDTNQAFTSSSYWNDTAPTATQLTLGSGSTNNSGATFIAYLFATLAGVSKVGSYTGTGSNVDVDCGFSAGARFILIKRTDSTGDWYVWDSVRGIVAGNDPYLLLNSTAAEVTSTDYIDPLSSGFTVTSSAPAALNASGGTYIFLAIA